VEPQARDRFPFLWQEYCKQRDNLQVSQTPLPFLQQAPGLAFPCASSMDVIPPSALLPTPADTPTVPMRLAQAPAQVALVQNSLGLFGQDLFASVAPLPDANNPFLALPPSTHYHPAASSSFPSVIDYMHYPAYTPVDTTFDSQYSSASTSSMPIPPAEAVFAPACSSFPSAFDNMHYSAYTPVDTTFDSQYSSASASSMPIPQAEDGFASDRARHHLQVCLEPFGALGPGLPPSQAGDLYFGNWLADF